MTWRGDISMKAGSKKKAIKAYASKIDNTPSFYMLCIGFFEGG